MKNVIKFITFVLYAFISYVIVIILAYSIGYDDAQEDCDIILLQKDSIMMLKDSIYQEHLKNCAFISPIQLDTNKYGDVFVLDGKELTFKELY
jgi:hypothetical protein